VSRVDFWVPDDIWKLAVHRSQLHDILCLRCFTRLADERQVCWGEDIRFTPRALNQSESQSPASDTGEFVKKCRIAHIRDYP
jgi:hypothetical protein